MSTLTIGDVLNRLQDDFPDITASKIRFLETEGLVEPDRTPGGYRKFTDEDIERLRYVLQTVQDVTDGECAHEGAPTNSSL